MFKYLAVDHSITPANIHKVVLAPAIKKMYGREDKAEHRGSDYRGVSKNGKSWQVFAFVNQGDRYPTYFGQNVDRDLAARIYDVVSIQTKGLEAETNYEYSKVFLLAILLENSFIDIKKNQIELQEQVRAE